MTVAERAPFETKGAQPERKIIYAMLLEAADFGDVVTYAQLDEVLGRPFRDNRSPFYAARDDMLELRKRWAEPVPNVGYRVIEANEHMMAAKRAKDRGRRQLGKMVKIGEGTDLSRLTPTELEQFDSQSRFNRAVYMAVVSHEKRLNRIEDVLRADGKL